MPENVVNLDQLAAQRAQAMVEAALGTPGVQKPVETLERLATKALGVLQEQGVYALMLFLFSRSSDEAKIAPHIRAELNRALQSLPGFANAEIPTQPAGALNYYADNVLNDLDQLLLARDLFEQTLIYARYSAKAAGE